MKKTYTENDHRDGKWHGRTDAATSPTAMWYTREGHSQLHVSCFHAVWDRLHELEENHLDGNGSPPVQIMFTRLDHHHPVIVYRFTSDWAYHKFRDEIVSLGSSLGRGCFQPWSSSDVTSYKDFVAP